MHRIIKSYIVGQAWQDLSNMQGWDFIASFVKETNIVDVRSSIAFMTHLWTIQPSIMMDACPGRTHKCHHDDPRGVSGWQDR